jgi:hypothetical protein
MLVGDECSHLLAVIRLRDCLDENEERLEPVLTDRLLLSILWKVHEDARQFFHRCEMWNRGEPLPKSNLKGMVRLLEEELTVIESITCPYDDFYGKADKGKEKGKGKDRDKAKEDDQKKREPQATVNPNIPTLCSATVKKILALHPNMSIPQFVAETGIPLKDLSIASRGSCTTFGVFGACRSNCSFRHDVRRNVPEGKQKDVNAALQKGLKVLEDKKKAASA